MKNGKKPTVNQHRLMQSKGLDSSVWLVIKDEPTKMTIVHKHSDKTIRIIEKEV